MCTKVRYHSKSDAEDGIQKLCQAKSEAGRPSHFNTYWCYECEYYHFGHKPRYRRRVPIQGTRPIARYAIR